MVPWPLPAATSAQVAHLKKQLEVAERAEAKAHADRQCRLLPPSRLLILRNADLKKQLEVAERAEAKAHADRQKSKKAESDIDRQALERIRTTSAPPTPSLSQPPLEDI